MKSWLQKNGIEMHSAHNEVKCVIVERFIRTLENEIYNTWLHLKKNVFIDRLDDIVNKTTIHIIKQLKWNQLV